MNKNWLARIRNGIDTLADHVRPGASLHPDAIRLRESLASGAKKLNPDTPLYKLRFVVTDTETTGLTPRKGDEIIALGAVVLENWRLRPDQTFHRLVNPGRSIPPQITTLTGITEEQVAGEHDLLTVLQEFLPFLNDACLVGHHLGFDLAFLNFKLRRFCGKTISNPTFDTLIVAKALYPNLESHSLDALLKIHGIEPTGRHTALGDAWLAARIFSLQLELLDVMRIKTVRDFSAFLKLRGENVSPSI